MKTRLHLDVFSTDLGSTPSELLVIDTLHCSREQREGGEERRRRGEKEARGEKSSCSEVVSLKMPMSRERPQRQEAGPPDMKHRKAEKNREPFEEDNQGICVYAPEIRTRAEGGGRNYNVINL
ncbi:hypothetical protein EYF80_057127 [Liparis tanakae]|uniref:Uncharacterized protein n=1 Tax=Liparis tanakae TaxID=230148 RepID=A0A4Z2EVN5_9TELE|nr:hypothetical protein EYF80_057127 [Liparis tanakae]